MRKLSKPIVWTFLPGNWENISWGSLKLVEHLCYCQMDRHPDRISTPMYSTQSSLDSHFEVFTTPLLLLPSWLLLSSVSKLKVWLMQLPLSISMPSPANWLWCICGLLVKCAWQFKNFITCSYHFINQNLLFSIQIKWPSLPWKDTQQQNIYNCCLRIIWKCHWHA